MILKIHVIPRASRNLIQKEAGGLKAYLTKPAQDGLANRQLIELLAGYLKVKKYQISIVQGEKSRAKTVKIDVPDDPGRE